MPYFYHSVENDTAIAQHRDDIRQGNGAAPLPFFHSKKETTGVDVKRNYATRFDWSGGSPTIVIDLIGESTTPAPDLNFPGPLNYDPLYERISVPSSLPPNLLNRALADLNNSKLDSAVILAEVYKTSSFLADSAVTLGRTLLDIKNLRFSRAMNRLGINRKDMSSFKTPADLWLKHKYAVQPLLMDVHNAFELTKGSLDRIGYHYAIGRAKANVPIYEEVPYGDGKWTITGSSIYNAKIFGKIVAPELVAAKALTSINPLSIAWEVTPFSFVVDWFLPIGDMLSAMTATVGLGDGNYYTSVLHNYESSYYEDRPRPNDAEKYLWSWSEGYISVTGKGKGYDRSVAPHFPTWQMPELEQGLSKGNNVITALALLRRLAS